MPPTAAHTLPTKADSPRSEFNRGIKNCLPVLVGMIPFALILGVQGAQKGMSVLEMPLMTGLNFAGGSEFAAVGLWGNPLPVLLIIAVTFMINTRHILMGAALTPYMRHLPLKKALPALFFMTDESWAMGIADANRRKARGLPAFSLAYYMGVSLTLYVMWVAFTALGAAVGPAFGDVEALGFGMAFPAVFLVLLRGMWKGFRAARPWLVSLAVAALVSLLGEGAWYVPAGAAAGLIAAYFWSAEA
ncbi:AzlC family ABC transporter permease [Uruburuella testudinis]|uniref:AzlC family ABC transporter permease n=1 Tax=Uruburuella testudinis TaxID=1282863 RepID=A0ABY4DV55_9NEIS|nr:AzlC family ABC transporter permease [Uruburuella testudinis]UOO82921.1 AzlC family ABC transporter permease [Uruburuella testudinis]